ncbi:MAG: phenylalanine--tRNA ligase subunit beta, partial [Myxococcota bacterium]
TLGTPIFDAFPAAVVLELSITPNRPDLLSHFGVAREVAAIFGTKLKNSLRRPAEKGAAADGLGRVLIDDTHGCRRYLARIITGVKVGPSPDWLRARLERIGQRSINNIVDATNYVLMELGHPLHAFDLSRLRAESGVPTIRVRRANDGETLVTLDDAERELSPEDLVIADAELPVALAGVMGGANSEVHDGTTSILLESAWFDPATVRKTAKRFGLHTEASHRFERGADLGGVGRAADRCAQLITEIAGGEVCKGVVEVAAKGEPKSDIRLRLNRIEKILGIALKSEAVVKLLEPLEIRCTARHESDLHFEAPTFRPDLVTEIDLIEEVARRYGYDEIPDTLPNAGGRFVKEAIAERPVETVRRSLMASGFSEAVTFGFGSPSRFATWSGQEGEGLQLLNPLGEELSVLRTTLMPGLLESLARNIRMGAKSVRLFEVGATFHPRSSASTGVGPLPKANDSARDRLLPREERRVGMVMWGERYSGSWFGASQAIDFSDVAGAVDDLLDAFRFGGSAVRLPGKRTGTNPFATAEIQVDGHAVGWAAQLHPEFLTPYEIDGLVFAAEISVRALAGAARVPMKSRPLPKFPSTRRDIAVLASRDQPSSALADYLRSHAGGALGTEVIEAVRLFDVYAGKGIPEEKVSLAFAIEYRHPERTLKDEEVNGAFQAVQEGLVKSFDVEIR